MVVLPAQMQSLPGHVPAAVALLPAVGRLADTNRLDLAFELPLRNRETLTNLLRQLYDPTSPNYHRYLTTEQFTARFGPTESDYEQLRAFAWTNGLAVVATHPNRLLLDVQGSVADIEKALHLTFRRYRHPSEAREFYAPDADPSAELAVPLMGISGLNNYWLARPRLRARPSDKQQKPEPNAGSGPSGTYMG